MRLHRGDPQRVATVLPGRGYTQDMPLLYFTRALLRARAWTVQEVWWEEVPHADNTSVIEVAREALSTETEVLQLLVGKSLGTRAIPLAVQQELPGIWLTPLLHIGEIAEAIPMLQSPSLLVGGTADESWFRADTKGPPVDVLELDGADHSLEVAGDAVASIHLLRQVMDRVAKFIDAL